MSISYLLPPSFFPGTTVFLALTCISPQTFLESSPNSPPTEQPPVAVIAVLAGSRVALRGRTRKRNHQLPRILLGEWHRRQLNCLEFLWAMGWKFFQFGMVSGFNFSRSGTGRDAKAIVGRSHGQILDCGFSGTCVSVLRSVGGGDNSPNGKPKPKSSSSQNRVAYCSSFV